MRAKGFSTRVAAFVTRFFLLVLVVSLVGACKRPSPSGEKGSAEKAVAPPDGLVSELTIAHPDRTWEAVRSGLGAGLPASGAICLGGALGLPVTALEQLDLNIPLVGAVVLAGEGADVVGAIHVKDGSRFVYLLASGAPRFVKDEKTSPGIV